MFSDDATSSDWLIEDEREAINVLEFKATELNCGAIECSLEKKLAVDSPFEIVFIMYVIWTEHG